MSHLTPEQAKEAADVYKNYQSYFLNKALKCVEQVGEIGIETYEPKNEQDKAYKQGYSRALNDLIKELKESF